jgi:transcriptional regulator with XRE-family HTH domain
MAGTSRTSNLRNAMSTVLARNLYRRRRAIGYSQNSLAAHAEVSQSWISRIEAGETPSLAMLTKLAGALKTDVSSLFAEPQRRTTCHDH